MTNPDVEPCWCCGKQPVVSVLGETLCLSGCFGDQQFRVSVWNETQRRITAELRKAFEAGANSIGWRDSSMLRQDTTFDDWQKQRGRK